MKKFLIPSILLLAASVSAQTTTHVMNIQVKGGEKIQYKISNIDNITFEETDEELPLIKNGDFGKGASSAWTLVNVNSKPFNLMKIDEDKGELQIGVDNYSQYGGDSRWMCYQKLDNPEFEVGTTYIMSAMINIAPQDFYMSDDGNNLKREMDFGFAIFPNTANMKTQNDYKPGDDSFWYMDITMDNGKGRYPFLTGTSGFESMIDLNINRRPDPDMKSGKFTMDTAHIGGYLVFYVRLRGTCPSVKPISIKDVKIEKYVAEE